MNWEEERWIKLYIRSTPEFLCLRWQARGLFRMLLTEVGASGTMQLGKAGLKAVSTAVHAPWAEIAPYLQELLDDGCIQVSANMTELRIRNFVEAQEATQSAAARQRARRARLKDAWGGASITSAQSANSVETQFETREQNIQNVTACDAPVTPRDNLENETRDHASFEPGFEDVDRGLPPPDTGFNGPNDPSHNGIPEANLIDAEQQFERFNSRLVTPRDNVVSQNVTKPSRDVTRRHAPSQDKRREDLDVDQTPPCSPPSPEPEGGDSPPRTRKRGPTKRVRTSCPDSWAPSEEHYKLASEECQRGRAWVDQQAVQMRDHFRSEGKLKADWDATFRNWLRREVEWGRAGPGKGGGPKHDPGSRRAREQAIREGSAESGFVSFGEHFEFEGNNE